LEVAQAIVDPSPLEDELQAMQWIVDGFQSLDRLARQRVLEWAGARYGWGSAEPSSLIHLAHGFCEMVDAVAKHQELAGDSAQVQDRELYEAVLKDTKYEKTVVVP
jgi:hypothetical protein